MSMVVRATSGCERFRINEGDLFYVSSTRIAPGGYEMYELRRVSDGVHICVSQSVYMSDLFESVPNSVVEEALETWAANRVGKQCQFVSRPGSNIVIG